MRRFFHQVKPRVEHQLHYQHAHVDDGRDLQRRFPVGQDLSPEASGDETRADLSRGDIAGLLLEEERATDADGTSAAAAAAGAERRNAAAERARRSRS